MMICFCSTVPAVHVNIGRYCLSQVTRSGSLESSTAFVLLVLRGGSVLGPRIDHHDISWRVFFFEVWHSRMTFLWEGVGGSVLTNS